MAAAADFAVGDIDLGGLEHVHYATRGTGGEGRPARRTANRTSLMRAVPVTAMIIFVPQADRLMGQNFRALGRRKEVAVGKQIRCDSAERGRA